MQALDFGLTGSDPLSLEWLLINLAVGLALSLVLRWHFQTFGSTLSNRSELAQVIPFVVLTTTLIITVIKSSIALSLGLVGALSIVRFRTPIKEPEELAYLFMAIAIGLGLGADQAVATSIAAAAILTVMGALKWTRRADEQRNLYLSLDLDGEPDQQSRLSAINEVLDRHSAVCDIRRVDTRNGRLEVTYLVDVRRPSDLSDMIADLKRTYPTVGITFIDQNRLPQL